MQPTATNPTPPQASFLKSIALATATLAVSTWALGSLWLHAEAAEGEAPAAVAGR